MVPLVYPNPEPKLHLDQLSHFCRAHYCDRQTDHTTWSVTKGRINRHRTVIRPNNVYMHTWHLLVYTTIHLCFNSHFLGEPGSANPPQFFFHLFQKRIFGDRFNTGWMPFLSPTHHFKARRVTELKPGKTTYWHYLLLMHHQTPHARSISPFTQALQCHYRLYLQK